MFNSLQNYGYIKNNTWNLSLLTQRHSVKPLVLSALKEKFLELLPHYMGAQRSEVNSHFRMLLARRKILRLENTSYLVGIYNIQAIKALWLAIDIVFLAVQQKKKILFISDSTTEEYIELQALNCLLYDLSMHAIVTKLGDIALHYNNLLRASLPLSREQVRHFDIIVVCAQDYGRLTRTMFQPLAPLTIGFCAQNLRPDLFDYYIPAMGTYEASVQLVRDVAILGYLSRPNA